MQHQHLDELVIFLPSSEILVAIMDEKPEGFQWQTRLKIFSDVE